MDRYAQKLINSGYGEDQARRIIYGGIEGCRAEITQCQEEGVLRTAKNKGRGPSWLENQDIRGEDYSYGLYGHFVSYGHISKLKWGIRSQNV